MEDRIRLTIEGGVADVRLSRADKLNALDPAMFKAIAETGRRLKDDLSVRRSFRARAADFASASISRG